MNILVVNDDGIQSAGLQALVRYLAKVGDVYVCAPDGQRSAKSHSVTLGQNITVEETQVPGAKAAYKTSGTPADCTKIGLQFFPERGIGIDVVCSGINMGSNLGRDTLYSGTVGAAAEAALGGYHAVAVSVDDHDAVYFETAGKLAAQIIPKICGKTDPSVVMNINVPNLPPEKIRGVKFAHLGNRYYDDKFHRNPDGTYALSGQPSRDDRHGSDSDVVAVHENYAVITPLQFDFTDHKTLEDLNEWSFNL